MHQNYIHWSKDIKINKRPKQLHAFDWKLLLHLNDNTDKIVLKIALDPCKQVLEKYIYLRLTSIYKKICNCKFYIPCAKKSSNLGIHDVVLR